MLCYRSLSSLGTFTSITCGGVKLVVMAITTHLGEMLGSCNYFARVRQIPTVTYNWASSLFATNAEY
jgi:hypothetical protein